MSSSSYLCDALNEHSIDFSGVSEKWLYNKDLHFLQIYFVCFLGYKDLLLQVYRKVGKGGVALLWNRKLDSYSNKNTRSIVTFQVYLPSRNHVLDVYKNCIVELENKGTVRELFS